MVCFSIIRDKHDIVPPSSHFRFFHIFYQLVYRRLCFCKALDRHTSYSDINCFCSNLKVFAFAVLKHSYYVVRRIRVGMCNICGIRPSGSFRTLPYRDAWIPCALHHIVKKLVVVCRSAHYQAIANLTVVSSPVKPHLHGLTES